MEGRKENKYNLSGICPQCGKLLKVELVVATELDLEQQRRNCQMPTKENQKEQALVLMKATAFDLLTKRGLLEQQIQQINQFIQEKVSEIKRLEADSDGGKD